MLTFTNDDARRIVKDNLGAAAVHELGKLDFLPFPKYVRANLVGTFSLTRS